MIQSTIGGRLTHWDTDDEKFEAKIRRVRDQVMKYLDLPGERIHYYGSCFDQDVSQWNIDTIWIDPPKVVDTQDVYSRMFTKLNSCLVQQDVELPKWKYRMVIPLLQGLWQLPCKRIIQFYCSDVRPTDDEVRQAFEGEGTVQPRVRYLHGAKADYIHILDKE
jgi:hypothetical protein